MTGYIERNGAWKKMKEAYIKTAIWFDPATLTFIPEQWKKAKEIWLNVGSGIWEKVFPEVITPVIENQVTLTSSTAAASGRTILTGRHYHWIDGDTITYFFEKTDSATPTFSSISSAIVTNPNTGTSSTVSYTVVQSDVTLPTPSYPNMANEYRFHVNAVNDATGGTADSYNTSVTNVYIYPPTDITSLSATPSASGVIFLSWASGLNTGSFKVEYKLSSSPTYLNWNHYDANPGTNTATVSGLSNGVSYDFRVTPYTGLRVDSTSSKGYYGNSSETSASIPPPPGDVTNGRVFLSPTLSNGSTTTVTQIQGYGNANYVIVTVTTEDFVKDGSYVSISGATGAQSTLNGSWRTFRNPDRSKFYLYNPSGTWASIPTQNYSSGCTARYLTRGNPYNITATWTPSSGATYYVLVLYETSTVNIQSITLPAGSSFYNFTSINGVANTKNMFYTINITPYNGSIPGSTYYFYEYGARSNTSGDRAVNTESAINSIAPSFVKISGYGTSAAPWQGDTYALAPGSWIFNGDGSAQVAVVLRDWAVDFGADYLIYEGYADYYVTSRPFGIPSFTNYQIPSNSTYGSPLYLVSAVSNDSTLDAVFPGDQGLGTYAFAQTGDITRLRGPGASTAESTGGKTSTNLRFFIYQNTPNPPNWYYFLFKYNAPVFGGNGVYTTTTASQGSTTTIANPHVLNITPLTASSWYIIYIYGYNNGVYSQELTALDAYTKATAPPSIPTNSDFYFERSGNTLYWWKIADNYTNVHLIWVRIDRYVGGVYQTSYNYYFYPWFYTVTSNLSGYPNNPSTSIRYSIDISSLPSGDYYPLLGFYNYDFGFSGPVQGVNIGSTYPFTK